MRKLTLQEIEQFASRPGVKRIAVENFLLSMGNNRKDNIANLFLDAGLYKWRKETIQAITDGIHLAETTTESLDQQTIRNIIQEDLGEQE